MQKNTIYLDSSWFNGEAALTEENRVDYILAMQNHRITHQFCDVGVLNDDGSLPAAGYSKLHEWTAFSRHIDSNQRIIPVLNYGNRKTNDQFGSDSFNQALDQAISHIAKTYDVDGIHLDIEGFVANDSALIGLLLFLKFRSMSGLSLSISTPASVWDSAYIRRVAKIVDQVNPMIYDTMGWGSEVVDEASYKSYFKAKIAMYSDALAGTFCELVPTLPSYEKKTADDGVVYHDPAVESMPAAISALNDAIAAGANVSGAGIFWGPHFMGLHKAAYDLFRRDQDSWRTIWIR